MIRIVFFSLALGLIPPAAASEPVSPPPPASPASSGSDLTHPIGGKLPGPQSPYTDALARLLAHWPPRDIDYSLGERDPNPVHVRCIETPGEKYYIGLDQFMFVEAPLSRVETTLDDVAHYKDLFPDFDDVHVSSRDGNLMTIFWEQHIPVFFIPNVKYETYYLLDKSSPDRKVYRYKIKESGHLKLNDGIIVLEKAGPLRTRYTEYDFYDADWGPLKTFAPGRIWKESVEGIYLSDVAIKLRAENPDWSYERIAKESREILKRFPVDAALEKRRRFESP
jgi:hypothetical protein